MSRREQPKIASMQLFPFMAVLICTMGSLVMLLVVIARQSSISGNVSQLALNEEQAARLRESQDVFEFQAEKLVEARNQTEAQVSEKRLKLSHLEDHLRRLRDEFAGLQTSARQLQAARGERESKQTMTQEELQLLRAKFISAQRELAHAQLAANAEAASYSVVPYEGRNHTRRRPIYIECQRDAVVLQPEGISLTETDFAGPLGPGNPLAAALRAIREQIAAQQASGLKEEPYPLLLVRPDGIAAYYAARAALISWGSEFGYELIEADWKLAYPPIDPHTAHILEQTLAEARVRQQALARAAPRSYGRGDKPNFGTGAGGGGAPGGPYGRSSLGGGFAGNSSAAEMMDAPSPGTAVGNASGNGKPRGQLGATNESAAGGSGDGKQRTPRAGSSGQSWTSDPGAISSLQKSQSSPSGDSSTQLGPSLGESGEVRDRPHEGKPPEKLAKTRGSNWGLPDAAHSAVPVTRPVTIECYANRLVIVPDQANAQAKQIPLTGTTDEAIEDLVSAVWQHMKGWGIAGRNLYWRPTLVMKVAPDAAGRYQELKALLDDSGLDVRQKGEEAASTGKNPLRH